MFCMKCGAKIPENGRFCPACGAIQETETVTVTETAPLAENAPAVQTVPVAQTAPTVEKKKSDPKKKRLAIILAAAAAVVIAAVVLLVINLNNIHSSPEKLAEAVVQAYCEVDVETMVEAMPDFAVRDRLGNFGLSAKASRKQLISRLKMSVNVYEQRQSVDVIRCIVTDRLDLDDSDYDDYGMTMMDYYSITDTALVEVFCFVDGEAKTIEVACIEIDNKWYMLDLD